MLNTAYYSQIVLDAVRCLVLAGATTIVGWKIGARLPRTLSWRAWAIIVAPLCTPALLVSYTYAYFALHLTRTPWLLTVFYSALIALKLMPLGVIARRMFPAPISPEGRFCEALIPDRSFISRLTFRFHALSPIPWMAGGLSFLLAFTDFELASLLSIKTWTVLLFDAHTGGLALSDSIKGVSVPLCIEMAVILTLVLFARHAPGTPATAARATGSGWALAVMGIIAIVTSVWPIVKILGQSLPGWGVIGVRETMGEDVLMSLATALLATIAIWVVLAFVRRWSLRFALALPGLLGALVLSLVLLAAMNSNLPDFVASNEIQHDWARSFATLADSPLPLIFAEMLLLAPVAVLVSLMLAIRRPAENLHLARMAGSRRLIWELALEPRVAALGLLFLLSYFEFTAATILAPVQLTPVCVRLHNLAHYGQTSALSAMLIAAMLAPAAVLALTLGGARFYARQNAR
jgi:hypothetical protein